MYENGPLTKKFLQCLTVVTAHHRVVKTMFSVMSACQSIILYTVGRGRVSIYRAPYRDSPSLAIQCYVFGIGLVKMYEKQVNVC